MNCDEVKSLLDLFLDDELDSRDTLQVQMHIDICNACKHEVESLQNQDSLLKQAAHAENMDSRFLREKILQEINRGILSEAGPGIRAFPLRFAGRQSWLRYAAAAALAAVIGLFALLSVQLPGVEHKVYAAMAEDHSAHCSPGEMMGAVEVPDQLNALSKRFIGTTPIPELSDYGYRNAKGRICKVGDSEYLHLVYYHQSNPPLSVFMRRGNMNAEHSIEESHDGLNVIAFSKSGVEMIVIVALDKEKSISIADAVKSKV